MKTTIVPNAEVATSSSTLPPEVGERQLVTIDEIGLARFVGRINSGVIPSDQGYEAIEQFVAKEKQRPLLSTLSRVVFGQPNSYERK